VTFTPTAIDIESNVSRYVWAFDDGESAVGNGTTHTFEEPGVYRVELTAETELGAEVTTSVEVAVAPETGPPVSADVAVEPTETTVGTEITARAVDVVGTDRIAAYRWSFGDGATARGTRVVHAYDDPGEYEPTLTIETDGGASRSTNGSVTVAPERIEILDVTVSPDGKVPPVEGVDKSVTVQLDAPSGVEAVAFDVGGDRFVDEDGTDGWGVQIPVEGYSDGTVVEVRAVGPNGEDTATRALGVGFIGPIPDYILQNAIPNVEPDRLRLAAPIPPPVFPTTLGGTIVVARFEVSASGRAIYEYLFSPPAVQAGGQLEGTAAITPGEITGSGTLLWAKEPGGPATGFDSVSLSLLVRGGISKEVGLSGLGYGGKAGVFFGPFVRADPIDYPDVTDFPFDPTLRTVDTGFQATGDFQLTPAVGEVSGDLTGRGFTRFPFPDPGDDVSLNGSITGQVTAAAGIFEVRDSVTIWEDGVQLTDVPSGTVSFRTHRGEVPLDGARLPAARSGVYAPAAAGRLTTDGVRDSKPALASTANGSVLAWSRQSPERTVQEGPDLYVRTAPAGVDGAAHWSASVRVTNDSRADLAPDVATHDGGALVAWTRLNRSFANVTDPSNYSLADEFGARTVAVARTNRSPTANGSTAGPATWSAPRIVATGDGNVSPGRDGPGSTFRPRVTVVGDGDGDDVEYLLAWGRDADADPRTADDRSVRYARYHPTNGSFGPVSTVPGAVSHRVASVEDGDGGRVAYFEPDAPGGSDGTVVVRDLASGTERRIGTTEFGDLAVTAETAALANGTAPNETIQYLAADGTVGRVSTGPVVAVRDVGLVSRRTTAGDRVDVLTFRGKTTTRNETALETGVFYRVRRGDDWTPARRLSPGGTDLTFAGVDSAGRERGFVSTFAGRNVSAPSEQADLFFVRHEYGTDLNVTATAAPTPAEPGEPLTVTYRVRNDGAVTARNATVTVADSTGTAATVRPVDGTIAPGETATGSVRVTANRSRTVRVAADSDAAELDPTDDEVTLEVMGPNLSVTLDARRPGVGSVSYDVSVTNGGPIAAPNATLSVTNDGRVVNGTARALGRLPPGGSTTVTVRLAGREVDPELVTRIRAVPADVNATVDGTGPGTAIGRAAPPAAAGRVRIDPPKPDLVVARTVEPVAGSNCPPETTVGPVTDEEAICVLVGNRGPVGTTATVIVAADDVERATQRVELPASRPNGTVYRSVAVDVGSLDVGVRERLLVRARPVGLDAAPADNVAGYEVDAAVAGRPFPDGVPRVSDLPPTDPDGDGRYEDVDGDRAVTYADVVALFRVFEADRVRARDGLFDYGGDGQLDYTDLVALFEAVGGR
jgi:PKD repeat protein